MRKMQWESAAAWAVWGMTGGVASKGVKANQKGVRNLHICTENQSPSHGGLERCDAVE